MTDSVFSYSVGIVALILTLWSVVLIWATWQLRRLMLSLVRERRELRRWKRISKISSTQNMRWQ